MDRTHAGSTQEYKFIYEFMTANQWLIIIVVVVAVDRVRLRVCVCALCAYL